MKQVELIRRYIAAAQHRELVRLRSYISMVGDNNDVLERMSGRGGEHMLARIVDCWMSELGHRTQKPADQRGSKSRRAVSKVFASK